MIDIKKLYIIGTLFCALLFALSARQIVAYFMGSQKVEASSEIVSAIVDAAIADIDIEKQSGIIPSEENQEIYTDLFGKLKAKNPDTVAYIRIENTKIDYPVVQAADNEYYIVMDFDGHKNTHGAIFMDYRNSFDFSDQNTILYGHNMRDGTMFKDLVKYNSVNNKSSLSDYVTIISEKGTDYWEVFSAYEADISKDFEELMFFTTNFLDEKEMEILLDSAVERSVIKRGIHPSIKDKILTLATCTNDRSEYRQIVHARKVDVR